MLRKSWKKKLSRLAAALVFAGGTFVSTPSAQAMSDTGWGMVASAISGLIAYKSSLSMMLDVGNNAAYQRQSLWQDIKANGTDRNARDVQVVDGRAAVFVACE